MSTIEIIKKGKPEDKLPKLSKLDFSIQKYNEELRQKIKDKDAWIRKNKDEREKARIDANDLMEKIKVCEIKKNYIKKKVDGTEVNKKVNDSDVNENSNNIITYIEGTPEYENVFIYYSNKINQIPYQYNDTNFYNIKKYIQYNSSENTDLLSGFDLKKYVRYRGPVIVAQEFYGSGVMCTGKCKEDGIITQPEFDAYDDRITKIYYDAANEKIVIKEFYRANVDVSIRYPETIQPILKGLGGGRSTKAGAFDFIVGQYAAIKGEISLRLFHYEHWEKYTKISEGLTNIKNCYINNSFDFKNYDNLTQNFDEFIKTPGVDDGTKKCILVHRGGIGGNGSKGCLTVVGNTDLDGKWNDQGLGDYAIFKKDFVICKLGMLFLFRDELLSK